MPESSTCELHPLKMSAGQLTYDRGRTSFQLRLTCFEDDFSAAFFASQPKGRQKADILACRAEIGRFLSAQLHVAIDQKEIPFSVKSIVRKDLVLEFQCESKPFAGKKVEFLQIDNSLLMDQYPEQENIIRVDLSGDKNPVTFRFNQLERSVLRRLSCPL